MASHVKGFIGDQPVELNNAATESTLAAMLAIAKHDSALLKGIAERAKVDAATLKKASDSLDKVGKEAGNASGGLGSIAPKASLVGGFLMDMGQSVMATINNLGNLTDQLMEGTARASDLFKAFKDLPLGLGLFATLLEKAMKFQERNLDVYREISKVGAGLSGSLARVRTDAADMNLTLEEFGAVIKANSDTFRQLAGNAGKGKDAFMDISKSIANSHLGKELYGLGYSFADVNNLIGEYTRTTADGIRRGKNYNDEVARIAAATKRYGEDLDFLARLTGTSREEQERKQREAQMETSWQSFLLTIKDPQIREQYKRAVMVAGKDLGKGGEDAVKAKFMGFAGPFSEEGTTVVSMMGETTKALEELTSITQSNLPAAQKKAKQDEIMARITSSMNKDMNNWGQQIAVMGQSGQGVNKQLMLMQDSVNKNLQAGIITEAQAKEQIENAKKKAESDKKASAAAIGSELAMKALSRLVNDTLTSVLSTLAGTGNNLVVKFENFLKKIDIEKLGADLAVLLDNLLKYGENLFSDAGRDKIVNDLRWGFKTLMLELKRAVLPDWMYDDEDLAKDKAKLNQQKEAFDALTTAKRGVEDLETQNALLEIRRGGAAREKLEADIKNTEAEIAKLKKKGDLNEAELAQLDAYEKTLGKRRARLDAADKLTEADIKNTEEQRKKAQAAVEEAKKNMPEKTHGTEGAAVGGLAGMWAGAAMGAGFGSAAFGVGAIPGAIIGGLLGLLAGGELGGAVGNQFASGTASSGSLLQDFGKESSATLHGKEAVLNEQQLYKLATGAAETGSAQAQEKLANAILALNKQQAMTNKILEQISDNTRRASENQGRWGNAFARV